MGTPVIGSTVRLTGKVTSIERENVKVLFNGSSFNNYIDVTAIVNAEVLAEPLKVGDTVRLKNVRSCSTRYKILYLDGDVAFMKVISGEPPRYAHNPVEELERIE